MNCPMAAGEITEKPTFDDICVTSGFYGQSDQRLPRLVRGNSAELFAGIRVHAAN
jgi:hypothetical protein